MFEFTGANLKQIRESKHISLEQVAKATRIQLSILRDLEDEEYAELASPTQVKGFLRVYAEYLGLKASPDPEPTASAQASDNLVKSVINSPKPVKKSKPKKSLKQTSVILEANRENRPDTRSQQILVDIGNELIARRRYLNLPWEVIVEQTHIPKNHLQALERGQIDELSTSMQARGLLQNYAQFLNLDVDMLSLRFADALQERRLEIAKPTRKQRKTASFISPLLFTIKRFFTLDLFFGSMLVLGILGFLIWGMARMADQTEKEPESTSVPAMIDVILATSTESPVIEESAAPDESASIDLPTMTPMYTPLDSDAAVQLVVIARQNVWVRVLQDGEEAFAGRLAPATATAFTAEETIELETGNAAALEFVLNEKTQEHTNMLGTAARFVFDVVGMTEYNLVIEPLPTSTPTLR
ncbi:MAG: RodZ domain-containing protein [Anaerolineaceae bacterium]